MQSARLAELDLQEVRNRLEACSPSDLPADMTALLRAQADRLRANADATQVTVHILSDLQQRDWLPRASVDDRGSSPLEASFSSPRAPSACSNPVFFDKLRNDKMFSVSGEGRGVE